MKSFNFIIVGFIGLCLCLYFEPSSQDLFELISKQELSQEAGLLRRFNEPEILFNRQKRAAATSSKNKKKPVQSQPKECGINSKSAAKGNSRSDSKEWPWLVSLMFADSYSSFCGGVLLNRNYVLTAAHCLHRRDPSDVLIRLGEYDFFEQNDTVSVDIKPSKAIVHAEYDPATKQNDIALIKLSTPTKYTDFIRPICLPTRKAKTNQTVVVAGWGTLYYGGPVSNVIMEVPIPVWDLENCISKYHQPVFKTNLCAAAYEGGKDACQGDSGGPLLMQHANGRWVTIGVVSWGMGCADKDQPGVYTDVSSYLGWISNNTKDAIL
ncbi:trypsin-1-like [Planococcus citri]|uniref:trypsin-1-like n=1 Tax=Planococcus citri TaxID=170843 RepID=UPI0031F9B931